MASKKRYVIERKPCRWIGDQEPEWQSTSPEFDDLDEAEREWLRLDDLDGRDTYHRLVEIKRKVLRCA